MHGRGGGTDDAKQVFFMRAVSWPLYWEFVTRSS